MPVWQPIDTAPENKWLLVICDGKKDAGYAVFCVMKHPYFWDPALDEDEPKWWLPDPQGDSWINLEWRPLFWILAPDTPSVPDLIKQEEWLDGEYARLEHEYADTNEELGFKEYIP